MFEVDVFKTDLSDELFTLMLSARELVRAIKEPRQLGEERRELTKCLERTEQTEQEVEQRVSSLFGSLASPRVAVRSSLSQAEWDEERREVIISRNSGRQEPGPLSPEEALFLLENNCLQLTRSEVPLSLQAAYTLLLSQTDLTLGKHTAQNTVKHQVLHFYRKIPGLLQAYSGRIQIGEDQP